MEEFGIEREIKVSKILALIMDEPEEVIDEIQNQINRYLDGRKELNKYSLGALDNE